MLIEFYGTDDKVESIVSEGPRDMKGSIVLRWLKGLHGKGQKM